MTTRIEWADDVWNPVTGCDRISPGCDHCYALTMARSSSDWDHYGRVIVTYPHVHPDALEAPGARIRVWEVA